MPLRRRSRNILFVLIAVFILAISGFFVGRYLIFRKIRNVINEQLASLRDKGVDLRYEKARFNFFTGKIEVYQLTLDVGKDSSYTDIEAVVPYLLLKGIKIIPFMVDDALTITEVAAKQPTVIYRMSAKLFESKKEDRIALDRIRIDKIDLDEIMFHLTDTLGKDTIAKISGDLLLQDIGIRTLHDSLVWRDADLLVENVAIILPKTLYKYSIKRAQLALGKKHFHLDSLRVIPLYDRRTFMRYHGIQTDRIGGVVAFVDLKDVVYRGKPFPTLQTATMEASVNFSIFRDKRFPFRKTSRTALPSHFLQRLPVQLKADTIKLKNSFISYEEFPEKGDSSGRVFFDRLQATIVGMHNDPANKNEVQMKAYSKFMGQGDLNVNFTFPGDTMKPYKVQGSLKNLPLVSLNNMLGSAVKARIESGTMTNLKFNFHYNMYRSDGEVELNYENLKISSLRENKDNEQAVSFIKTLLLNTFIIKKNMDEDMSHDEKSGTIAFIRDTRRSLFNYWWKSVLSGIKSAYKLDKLPISVNGKKKKKDDKVSS